MPSSSDTTNNYFETNLMSYLEELKRTKPNSYISYSHSKKDAPLFYHNGTQSAASDPPYTGVSSMFSRMCSISKKNLNKKL